MRITIDDKFLTQRDRLVAALKAVQHTYRKGFQLTDAQKTMIDSLLHEIDSLAAIAHAKNAPRSPGTKGS